jgi:hypothetical protein
MTRYVHFKNPGKPTKCIIGDHKAIVFERPCHWYRISEAEDLLEELEEAVDEAHAWMEKYEGREMGDDELLAHHGWDMDCMSPLEISKDNGGERCFASGEAAYLIIQMLRNERYGDA